MVRLAPPRRPCPCTSSHPAPDLVPVKLDIKLANQRLLDYFCWPTCEDDCIEPFVEQLCRERHLPLAVFKDRAVDEVRKQVEEYRQAERGFPKCAGERLDIIRYLSQS